MNYSIECLSSFQVTLCCEGTSPVWNKLSQLISYMAKVKKEIQMA